MKLSHAIAVAGGLAVFTCALAYGQESPGDPPPPAPAEGQPDTEPGVPMPVQPASGTPDVVPDVPVPSLGKGPTVTPTQLRLRRLEQSAQALKERVFRAKATVTMLKERVVGGGVGAQISLVHKNDMGSSFRLIKLAYAMDSTQIFSRNEKTSKNLYKVQKFDILTGPIAPGTHTVNVLAVYRGHGYGVFRTLKKYTFTVRSSHTFTIAEGKTAYVEATAYEKGSSLTTKMQERPAVRFKVSSKDPDAKPAAKAKTEPKGKSKKK